MDNFFSLYYGFWTWVVCDANGALESSWDSQFDADLRSDLLNFMGAL
jgi:hypothetical protein